MSAFILRHLKSITLAVCLLPLLWLIADTELDRLGANPIQAVHIRLGDWAMRFLWITLTITPVQSISKWRGMADYRQIFGLYSFLYASLHLLAYLWVDHALAWDAIVPDVLQSNYLWMGLIAYSLILLMAITSSKWAMKRMGKQWKRLHRYIYLASVLVILHYYWQLKGNLAEPGFYLVILGLLLGFRLVGWLKSLRQALVLGAGQRD
ncbi:sulfite oxidase heme-binding subunit YedZ [Methylomonas sp. MED-D]|uniref:Protein-methionine-sulfoxide reductase heme-binding subunit MsrQ n=1 Tax=Methylomonas koyamae TaxID=702114 RepID=A0A177NA84_9GAMM|nr:MULTISPECIES: protein-methionine-sulfoxide reductase heme-binding subunit MsrQ [Methylomonas]MDT4329021.1 protein-methionine-sulfoxide reductase heme-binding subunit MsrQ [Methylomonas sp. MV1]NJA04876.1 sulfoxide reductase heme-binding subunit YedZ [Methylococcaceae bacterium WWC4]OAI14956.1 sulfoxide reductase heme-binding subunit YedZ [Methylomonas koyamae]WGS87766.1 protein-methionine-sulfoxide reductase heme-binding subunit MsrQ [Methylomonas sp. UP202]